ncbi:MAG: zinc-binding dehydrogenase [Hyphomicrobiales bacterium]|nr:zinc-binding dehydrogenase [Hyphomicrobiales bacterium]MCP4997209.1 zinc-binding dehydrogenase [Hyphomicrobiales bacterium]
MPRAWVIHHYSGYQGLTLENFDAQEPGPGEIRLKVEAFALNWGDMDLMCDRYSFSFREFPARIGIEAAGIVDAVGADVTGIEIGERYCTLPYFYYERGASTESMVVDARYLTKAPPGLSAVEATSIWMQYLTAYFPIVEISKAAPGKTFLITAATGTAGTAALEIGRHCGATMIATSRFDYNRPYLEAAGADHVIISGSGDIAGQLRELTDGKGIDAAFDPIGAGMIGQYAPALARNARIYFYGTLDETMPTLPIVDMFQANAVFHPYSVFNYVEDEAMCSKGKAFIYDAIASGSITPRIDRTFPMEGYRDAWDYLKEPRKTHGKVVIETGL